MSTPAPSRRGLLGALAALPLAAIPVALPVAAGPNPDADLIAACAEHIRLHEALNASPLDSDDDPLLDSDDDPLWPLYDASYELMQEQVPHILPGLVAEARVALVESTRPDGAVTLDPGLPAELAIQLMEDIVRIADAGGAA